MRVFLILCAVLAGGRLEAAFKISTDFESGSARGLESGETPPRIRIAPAGDPRRGMPNWWCLRIDGLDTNQPLTLEVNALDVPVPGSGDTKPLNPGWTLPERAAISPDGISWRQTA